MVEVVVGLGATVAALSGSGVFVGVVSRGAVVEVVMVGGSGCGGGGEGRGAGGLGGLPGGGWLWGLGGGGVG